MDTKDYNNNNVFDNMTAVADRTKVDIWNKPTKVTTDDIHHILNTSGMVPGIGNASDLANSILYTLEGQYGEAVMSLTSMVPFLGQTISARKMLKAAKEAGETTTLWRGADSWHKGKMVKDGKFVGGGKYAKDDWEKGIWTTTNKQYAIDRFGGKGVLMEFEVPNKYLKEQGMLTARIAGKSKHIFPKGLPAEFLVKIDKP